MDTTRSAKLLELAAPLETELAGLTDAELSDRIAHERSAGLAFGLVAELCRHELARRTAEAAQ